MEEKEGHNYNSLGSEEEKKHVFLREMFSEEQQQNRIRQEQMLYQQNRVPRKEKHNKDKQYKGSQKQTRHTNKTQSTRVPERQYREEGKEI